MALTDPFFPDVDERMRQSVTHIYSVTAYPVSGSSIPLDVEDLRLSFDESWSPHIQADITAKVPEDQTILDALDPRKNCRVQITLGYIYDGAVKDYHVVADLHLRTREVLRPANELRLTATSDEARAQDAKRRSADAAPPKTGINEIVSYVATKAVYPEAPVIVSDFGPGYGVNSFTELDLNIGKDFDSLRTDAANRVGVWIYCDGSRRWRITTRASVSGVSACKLFVGPDGTIFSADATLQRDEFYNSVCLKYSWTDASKVDWVIYGEAYVPGTGPYGVDATGYNTYPEERQGPITQAQATAAAQTVLKGQITRGHGIRLEAAACYWLRPGMTVTVQLPTGDQERHLVSAVSFSPAKGLMSVTTRQPETVTIS